MRGRRGGGEGAASSGGRTRSMPRWPACKCVAAAAAAWRAPTCSSLVPKTTLSTKTLTSLKFPFFIINRYS